jgi:molecular chaperone DnaK
MREAEQYAEEDRRRREDAETRNQAEQLVYTTEDFLKENQEKVQGDVRSEVEEAVADLKERLKGEDTTAIRQASERVAAVSQKLGQAMYGDAQAGTAGGAAAGGAVDGTESSGPGGADSQEDVVDAEIVDDEKGDDTGEERGAA